MLLNFKVFLLKEMCLPSLHVKMESLSVRERMSSVLERVRASSFTRFNDLFTVEEGRMGVVVTFLAILELSKESLLEISQAESFAPIHVKAAGSAEAVPEQATGT